MKVVCIDIETTGLDPSEDQIIEFAAVFDDWTRPGPVATFAKLIRHQRIYGSIEAVAMHDGRWRDILMRGVTISDAAEEFAGLCQECGFAKKPRNGFGPAEFTAAGKNFAAFDRRFLDPYFDRAGLRAIHRSLDPVAIYAQFGDIEPPNLAECCRRAGVPEPVPHVALSDALAVCALLRAAKGLPWDKVGDLDAALRLEGVI
jgi:hypothetical protein